MPKIDIAAIPVRERTAYPPRYAAAVKGRLFQALGDAAGLTQFGVSLVRLRPGAWSSQRHWHEQEDEFLLMLEGELVLVEDEGETVMRPGDAAAFKAGVPNGHHLINRSDSDGVFLVVGSRADTERAHYPDADLAYEKIEGRVRYTNRAGRPFA
jgi:uncharacterized cupin superfamily protein